MTLSLDTAYRSFGGEVEASSTPTICRLPDSRRHQLWAIARGGSFFPCTFAKRAPGPVFDLSLNAGPTATMAPVFLKGMTRQPAYEGDVACGDRQLRLRFDLRHWTRCAASVPCWWSCSISRFTMRSRTSPRSPICNFASTCSLPCHRL